METYAEEVVRKLLSSNSSSLYLADSTLVALDERFAQGVHRHLLEDLVTY